MHPPVLNGVRIKTYLWKVEIDFAMKKIRLGDQVGLDIKVKVNVIDKVLTIIGWPVTIPVPDPLQLDLTGRWTSK